MHLHSAMLDSPFLFPATSQLPCPSPDMSASGGECHTGRPSPSTSSPSQIFEGSVACTIPYNRMPRDQLENLARWLKRSHIRYLSNATDRQVGQLHTRALSTGTIEGSFAEINSSMRYKATPQQLEPHLRQLDLQWSIKHAPNLFHTMQSSR